MELLGVEMHLYNRHAASFAATAPPCGKRATSILILNPKPETLNPELNPKPQALKALNSPLP